jgi:hypothetical protein
MVEVVGQECCVNVARSAIHDIVYVLPLSEVESGLFHMFGSYNCFYIRYSICKGALIPTGVSDYYFVSRPVEPIPFDCIIL